MSALARRLGWLVLATACSHSRAPFDAAPSGWKELRVAWDYGPCSGDDATCHQTVTVHPRGAVVTTNGADRQTASLSASDLAELQRLVTDALVSALGSLPCARARDATVRLEIDGHRQEVSGCEPSSAPRAIVAVLAPYRFHGEGGAGAPPASHAGEACTEPQGCPPGFVCAIAPCVVAPCTSGTCQPTK